ncbi:RNase adapter RapZ [Polynucleobacter sp. MWH-Spelu-300-X4]|uniref:RNase adapter RapZ n=1 Tax=Polynucleobacter sp. MWH-Spelu-300-X4 TaxID=2689109 RepID=UPI001BFCF97F|nr:RNase adapter RapZ [Polynucleobacter sp. MWH-Spelu-300-X4]QWD79642.1 RNase adapter RapZ [Polynucleobacter sp. MWH-Spelu-300-X4]
MRIFIITGISGSGKSVALNALEDAGYDCVDNLPVSFIHDLAESLSKQGREKLAIAVDARRGHSIKELPDVIDKLNRNHDVRILFLNANTETLVQRYSETRRRHPLSQSNDTRTPQVALIDAIEKERELLSELAETAHNIDTSHIKAHTLRSWIQDLLKDERPGLTILFESFGFKHGVPRDADLVFDVRCLPNPHYDPQLRPLTGNDPEVANFLREHSDVQAMGDDIRRFIETWLPKYQADRRSYLTIAIGCTGGQHRSVYLSNCLFDYFEKRVQTSGGGELHLLKRHRELESNSTK